MALNAASDMKLLRFLVLAILALQVWLTQGQLDTSGLSCPAGYSWSVTISRRGGLAVRTLAMLTTPADQVRTARS